MGMSVGIVTSVGEDAPLKALDGIQIVNIPTERSTIFENVYTEHGRKQTLHHQATLIEFEHIPHAWRNAPIVHLAPIAQELNASLAEQFPASLVGVTPQGWMRGWDENGKKITEQLHYFGSLSISVEIQVNTARLKNPNYFVVTRVYLITVAEASLATVASPTALVVE